MILPRWAAFAQFCRPRRGKSDRPPFVLRKIGDRFQALASRGMCAQAGGIRKPFLHPNPVRFKAFMETTRRSMRSRRNQRTVSPSQSGAIQGFHGDHKEVQEEQEESENRLSIPVRFKAVSPPEPLVPPC